MKILVERMRRYPYLQVLQFHSSVRPYSGYPDFVPNIMYQFNFVPPFFDMLKKTLVYRNQGASRQRLLMS